jgi:hypothetical protein
MRQPDRPCHGHVFDLDETVCLGDAVLQMLDLLPG